MRFRLRASLLVALVPLACRPAPATPSETPDTEAPAKSWLPEAEVARAPEKPVRGPIDLVPADAFAAAEFTRVGDLLGLGQELPALFGVDAARELFDELREETGVDFRSPGALADVGVDPDGPVGVAVIDLQGEAVMTWFGVADEPRLLAKFKDQLSRAEELQRGDARIFRFEPGAHLVLRRGFAFVIAVDNPERASRDHMAALVARRGGEGLGHSMRWERAFRDLDPGHGPIDMRAYVSPVAGLEVLLAEMRESETRSLEFHRRQVESARQTGANPAEIRELERQLDESMRQSARMRALADNWVRPMESLAFAGAADAEGLWASGRFVAPRDALVRRLIRFPDRGFVLPKSLDHSPVAVLEGAWNMQTLEETAAALTEATGDDGVSSLFRMFMGFDPRTDLFPLLDGSMGAALTLNAKTFQSGKGKGNPVTDALGFAVHMGVHDEVGARRFLDDLSNSGAMASLKRDRARWKIEIPDWQTIWFDVGSNRITLSTDTKLAARVAAGSAGQLSHPWPKASAPLQRSDRPTLFSGAWDFAAIGAIASSDFNAFDMDSEWKVRSRLDFGELDWEERERIAQSGATKAAVKRLRAADKQLGKLQRKRSAEIAKRWLELGKALGPTMWSATEHPEHVDLEVRVPFFGGVTAVDDRLARVGGETSVDAAIAKQQTRSDDLLDAAVNAWQKDVDRVLRRR